VAHDKASATQAARGGKADGATMVLTFCRPAADWNRHDKRSRDKAQARTVEIEVIDRYLCGGRGAFCLISLEVFSLIVSKAYLTLCHTPHRSTG
jgi:hypothetical protein